MELFIESIKNLGFPIAISIYLLVRLENKLEDLRKTIEELTRLISSIV